MSARFARGGRHREVDAVYGKGLVVYRDRWKAESGPLRRLLPVLTAKFSYFCRSLATDGKQQKFINAFQSKKTPPLFSQVEVETQNRCNGTCAFCPVNRNAPQRTYARMNDELYESVIEQLAGLRYSKALSLHSNNEPLLDKRLPDFAAFARKRLPKAKIKMFTNGTLLTLDLFRELMPSFDRIFINNYNDTPDFLPNIQEIHDFCTTPEGENCISGKTVVIQLRDPHAVLSSRAGNAPNRKPPSSPPGYKCKYPFVQFIIRPDGRVSLCCNDALGQTTLGDLNDELLLDVWRGPAYADIRTRMAEKGRSAIPLCAVCDFQK